MDLQLSPKDRLFLANQLKILEVLYPEEAKDYAKRREAVEGGYSIHYDKGAEWIGHELTPDQCREVGDILEMFEHLQLAHERLEGKSGIDEKDVKFLGFDENNESGYLAYASYRIRVLGEFDRLKCSGDGLNSHLPLLDSYRRMLAAWRESSRWKLDANEIRAIAAERVHPDSR